jgi:hypothetical protein
MKNAAQVARELGVHPHTVEKYLAFTRSHLKDGTSPKSSERRHRTLGGLHLKAVERRLSQCALQIHKGEDRRAGLSRRLPERPQDHSLSQRTREVLGEPLADTSPGISSAAAQAAGILVKRPERTALKKRDEHL